MPLTARKERAGHRRGKLYWRAYHTLDGRLRRVYLGQSEALTLHQLQAVAARLSSMHAGQVLEEEAASCPPTVSNVGVSLYSGTSPSFPQLAETEESAQEEKCVQLWPSMLPMPLTSFFGREREIATLTALLQHKSVRIVTLTGTGGVGKIRLALSLVAEVADTFADGVCFVPLAPISDPEQVIPAIAKALGLWEALDHPHSDHVRDFLREKHLLLLLDNFEQVAAASPQVAALAVSCPRLHLLMTSRAALHLSGEHEFPVPPLPTPDLTHLPELQDLAQVAAVHLFVEIGRAHV